MGNTGSTYSGTRKVNSHRHTSRSGGGGRHKATNIENTDPSTFSKNENGRSQRISSNRNKTKRVRKSKREQKQTEEEEKEEIDDSI